MSLLLACILSIHDGDSITTCQREKVRISNIDAPELRGSPSCRGYKAKTHWCDYRLGIRSRDALMAFVAGKAVRIDRQGRDRYGRTLARLSVNGVDAGAYLVSRGLARPWR